MKNGYEQINRLKKAGLAVLFAPFALIIIFVLYELIGMGVNHAATEKQTEKLQANLENAIPDIKITDIYSETGNTSGTGNHVDCLSTVTFSTQLNKIEIEDKMSQYYELNEWSCFVDETEDGYWLFYLNTSAPFSDNIEGH